jgi:hypothetical protein
MSNSRTTRDNVADQAGRPAKRRAQRIRACSPYMKVTPTKTNCQRRGLKIADWRSPEGRFVWRCKKQIIESHFPGRRLTSAEQSLIHRIAMIELRCELLDREFLESSESNYDEVQYIARTNTLIKLYTKLGIHRGRTDMATLLRRPK